MAGAYSDFPSLGDVYAKHGSISDGSRGIGVL
jgi:hypothetical protein